MSHENEMKRPLDAEELTVEQMDKVAGGSCDPEPGVKHHGKKAGINSPHMDASSHGRKAGINTAGFNVSDRD